MSVKLRRWSIAGLLLGGLIALVTQAPAHWLARALADSSGGRLLLTETRGSVWDGSASVVLSGGPGSKDASALPGRAHWQLGWSAGAPELRLQLDCCSQGTLPLRLHPGWGKLSIDMPRRDQALLRLPAGWLAGLGTPWNTLQPSGQLRLSAREASLDYAAGQWKLRGLLEIELAQISSRVSTLAPLGSYRLSLMGQGDGRTQMQLGTLEGALQLNGSGQLGGGARVHFEGEATAAPGQEAALNNLLNIIGRRQGARSVITIG